MASVFTFEPEPPKLASPWRSFPSSSQEEQTSYGRKPPAIASIRHLGGLVVPEPVLLAECGLTRLEGEPQEGPTEYKLHLLLRPRRSFLMISTNEDTAGLQQSHSSNATPGHDGLGSELSKRSLYSQSSSQPTTQTRQNRLQHLTTQLLWRLQQSSPYHSSSVAELVIPQLPEASPRLGIPLRPEKLLPGLESSRGALYEIGVADDGSFVGLAEDEMNESLTNLRAMAASLGCNVEIVRLVIVGDCEWVTSNLNSAGGGDIRKEALFVAEALVLPASQSRLYEDAEAEIVTSHTTNGSIARPLTASTSSQTLVGAPANDASRTQQLRVSLTGRTTAGKSSLLGTISTSTLDNGRGKSRLSLLKHRHEIATGMTSSVAPELIGYAATQEAGKVATIINYSCGNISSWDDIHNVAEGTRLVFITDSAGHPRYRRTIVRGLVSWAPHWTLCCIPADEDIQGTVSSFKGNPLDDSGGQADITRSSFAHLSLCLRLKLPLVVIITKHDHATKDNLRHTLSGVLSMIKAYGKRPNLMIRPGTKIHDLQFITSEEHLAMQGALEDENVVPIILVSAVSGSGISQLHTLLYNLPIQTPDPSLEPIPTTLFHVDEVYTFTHTQKPRNIVVLSGYLRYGTLSVGDFVHVGPFMTEAVRDSSKAAAPIERTRSNPSNTLTSPLPRLSQSMPRWDQQNAHTPPPSTPAPTIIQGEFTTARVVSIRNLRLPIRTLLQDQAGTVGIEFSTSRQPLISKLRKGMVLARTAHQIQHSQSPNIDAGLKACTSVQVRFHEEDYEIMEPGAVFNVYVASVRAVAKIVTVEAVSREAMSRFLETQRQHSGSQVSSKPASAMTSSLSSLPGFEEDALGDLEESFHEFGLRSGEDFANGRRMIDVVFHFLYYPEWIECGAKVLAMPSQAIAGGIGLDGFVGQVVETLE